MDDLERLVRAVAESKKYASVCPDLVRRVGARELSARRSWKAALKATKSRLHRVGGAFLDEEADYPFWLEVMRRAAQGGRPDELRAACRSIMQHQSSTRERLPILERFFTESLAGLEPPKTVLDIACGLAPLSIPWMPLAPGALYLACDMYDDLAAFLRQALPLLGVSGLAEACDAAANLPLALSAGQLTGEADLALMLKSLPCLEQLDNTSGRRLLETVPAKRVLVSFPMRSLGGRDRGMPRNYEEHFRALVSGQPGRIERFEFPGELAFLITR
jgi:16S rRNA (guanine(1405)-N(7))-methyltransferase